MTDPTQKSLSDRAKRGGMWVLAGKAFESVSRLVGNIILAWLLFREAFGVIVPVRVFLIGMQLFSDVGIGPSIVRSKRGEDPVFLRTVWTVQVLRGFLLYGICCAIAGTYAMLVGEPLTAGGMREQEMIRDLLYVAGLSALFLGFRSPHWFTLDRKIAQGRKTMILVLSQTIAVMTMIVWAYFHRSPYALVAGGVTGALCQTLFSHFLLPGVSMRFRFERAALVELFGFGRWIFLSTALVFFASQVDRILITKFMETGPRGDFGIAFGIAILVPTVLASISGSVVFPTWMESFRRGDQLHADRVLRSRRGLSALCIAGLLGVVILAPLFFKLFYKDEYLGAAVITQLLCIPLWFAALTGSASNALLVHGDSRSVSMANLLVLLVKIPACWLGFRYYGVAGFILGMAVGGAAGLLRLHLRLARHGVHLLLEDVKASLVLLVGGLLGYWVAENAPALGLGLEVLLVAGFAAAVAFLALRPARVLLQRKPG